MQMKWKIQQVESYKPTASKAKCDPKSKWWSWKTRGKDLRTRRRNREEQTQKHEEQ